MADNRKQTIELSMHDSANGSRRVVIEFAEPEGKGAGPPRQGLRRYGGLDRWLRDVRLVGAETDHVGHMGSGDSREHDR